MTKDHLFSLWNSCLSCTWAALSPKSIQMLNDYVNGAAEVDSLQPLNDWNWRFSNAYNGPVLSELARETQGEQGQLARRMLYAIVTCRHGGPLWGNNTAESLDMCIKSGYSIQQLMELMCSLPMRRQLELNEVSWYLALLAEVLKQYPRDQQLAALQCCGQVTAQSALSQEEDQQAQFALYAALLYLLGREDEAIRAQCRVLLLEACRLWVLHNPDSCSDHSQLWKLTNKPGPWFDRPTRVNRIGLSLCSLLAQEGDGEMTQLLAALLPRSSAALCCFNRSLWQGRSNGPAVVEEGCRLCGLPHWICCLALLWDDHHWLGDGPAQTASFFQKVIKEDRSGLEQAMDRAIARADQSDVFRLLYVCALFCQMGDSRYVAPLEELTVEVLSHRCCQNRNFVKYLTGQAEISQLKGIPYQCKNVGFPCACLYTYSDFAKRMVDLILCNQELPEPSPYQYNFIALAQDRKTWLGASLAETGALFLSNGHPLSRLAYPFFADAMYTNSHSVAQRQEEFMELGRGHEDAFDGIFALWKDYYTEARADLIALFYSGSHPLTQQFQPLAQALTDKSAVVRKLAEKLGAGYEAQLRPLLEKKLPTLKGDKLATVKRLLKRWNNQHLLEQGLCLDDHTQAEEFCTKAFDSDEAQSITWIPDALFSGVRYADLQSTAAPQVLRYILSEYMGLTEVYRVGTADQVAQQLCQADLQQTLESIYHLWLEQGANTKQKFVMLPYCLYASDSQILKLRRQLEEWAGASRGALAAWVVQLIALNASSVSLLMVEGISNKFPNNQVKKAAKAAFSFAANTLGLPEAVLADRIVPNLGFDTRGERLLDYGPRSFRLTLGPNFTLSIYDMDKQKAVKSLPKAGANDDPVKAQAAQKEFSELKKQMKAVVQNQTLRLRSVLMNGRRWDPEAWKQLFVENPIMHRFATGLIWAVYEGEEQTASFRYLEDGSFSTVDEEEYILPQDCQITLAHPVELGAEVTDAWRQQLEDYEVVQPLPQLDQPIIPLEEKDLMGGQIVRWNGKQVASGAITNLAKKYDMLRTEALDAGCYSGFMLPDRYLGVYLLLTAEYFYMGQSYDETVQMEPLRFCQIGPYGELNDDPLSAQVLDPKALPPRFVNSVLAMVAQVLD